MFTIHSDSGSCFASNSIGSFLNRRSSLFPPLSFFLLFFSFAVFRIFPFSFFHLFLFLFFSLSLPMLPVNFCRYFREACTRGTRMRIHDRNNASISIVFLAQPAFRKFEPLNMDGHVYVYGDTRFGSIVLSRIESTAGGRFVNRNCLLVSRFAFDQWHQSLCVRRYV